MFIGFCELEVDGVPPGKDHDQEVGLPVLLSVKEMQSVSQINVFEAESKADGTGQGSTTINPV